MRKFVLMVTAAAAMLVAAASASFASALVARVDVSSQTMTVSKHGRVLYTWPVSTARSGYITPRGQYKPTRMHKMWYSRKYDMSPMPYSIFFRGGYAIHGTNYVKQLGRPASHGCVRLHTANAARLYALVKEVGAGNAQIVVTN
ncbi:L,D-transpeptidase [Aquibium sp. ELW1220]|uniref:L,D-transpeptidase n=1 Tax=Aquibium sp. ELW1220 TaxID=2976766 RepID=UPI0025B006D4|nr:L,D-transpeptidase [Aquibium sp. ELW1220]MDN2583130.1 L,D-transpeptidase [Aquibium sp. ELW1220]